MGAILVGVGSFILFLLFQSTGISGGDSGDLVTAAVEFGVPHPPGYPLYTALAWLATRLPFSTPAWRAGLVSSIPHALTLALAYRFVVRLTSRVSAGIFCALALGGNYLFFLYSVTPEVFALFDLFVILLLSFLEAPRFLSFLFGLSLTHHHVILFLLPAIAFSFRKRFALHVSHVMLFLAGLLPYLYVPVAARGGAIVNWDRAEDWKGFIRLVTRQDYGSFVTNGFYGALPIHRLLQLKAYATFLMLDFGWVGVLLAILGCVALWRRHRPMFWVLLLSLVSVGPVFFFYASFPLMNRFSLGTYERFLLPSYVLLALAIGVGYASLCRFRVLRLLLFVFPFVTLSMTTWRFWGLAADRTADRLGEDVLRSVGTNAILLLSQDTPLFITQYVRYAAGVRTDVILLHANRLWSADYPKTIAARFPQLVVPESDSGDFARAFLRANRDTFPIYTNTLLPLDDGWFWVQQGLVYRLTKQEDLPRITAFIEENDSMWRTYGDPQRAILARYKHLMLSDVISVYADARIRAAKMMLRGGNIADAKRYLIAGIDYDSDIQRQDGYTYLGLAELFEHRCDEALLAFSKAREASLVPEETLAFYEGITYRDCAKDAQRAAELLDRYERLRSARDTSL